jgi:hypothetical protein
MSVSRMPPAGQAADGDYHGHPTRRLQGEHVWVEVLAKGGPRIVRFGFAGSLDNLLAETPDVGWETPHGRYELLGGHRLWFAPEDPDRVAVPDAEGLIVEPEPDGLRLTGMTEPETGLVRSITVRLDPSAAAIELYHELRNVGESRIELSPWSITQLPLGGSVLLPQPEAIPGHAVRPNRTLVLWPYTSWDDERLELRDGLISVRAAAGGNLKVGYFNRAGWVAYWRADVALVRRFDPIPGRSHPDLGCNVEAYCGSRFLELELLGPLDDLAPGGVAVLNERWELFRHEDGEEAGALDGRGVARWIMASASAA